MGSVVVVIVVGMLVFAWVRGVRENRRRWLARLDLPGTWLWEGHDGVLELSGGLDRGGYRIRENGSEEEGDWRLEGHGLILAPRTSGRESVLDLRLFTEGKIGIHGPGRERRIYVKKRANVIPLRRPA
jgi:hypothetical protein